MDKYERTDQTVSPISRQRLLFYELPKKVIFTELYGRLDDLCQTTVCLIEMWFEDNDYKVKNRTKVPINQNCNSLFGHHCEGYYITG